MVHTKTFYLSVSSDTFIELNVDYFEEKDKRITAKCRELGTASFGNDLKEAEIRIKGAIETHLLGLAEEHILDKTLEASKVRIFTPSTTSKVPLHVREHPVFLTEEPKEALSA